MNKVKDLSGKVFGRLIVKERQGTSPGGQPIWLCKCSCGNEVKVEASNLKRRIGATRSCGCYRRYYQSQQAKKHGIFGTPRYGMYKSAKNRAKKKNVPFSLQPTDVPIIPEKCPVLNIPLIPGKGIGGMTANSPTLDRIIPVLGYTPGNVRIISQRANVIKNDASVEEIELVAKDLRRIQKCQEDALFPSRV